MPKVLLLAGTTEATRLAARLVSDHVDVLSSLAGVTKAPRPRPGRVRHGGFGGVAGLTTHLCEQPVDAVIDATHPFAAVMPFHAHEAAQATGTPHCRLLRPAWKPQEGDRWTEVRDLAEAADAVASLGASRTLLTVGSRGTEAFTELDGWFLVRAIEATDALPPRHELLQSRGPFDFDAEVALMQRHRIDAIVTKNAGGTATEAKLAAARALGVPVVIVRRPPQPPATIVRSEAEALEWWSTQTPS